MLLTPVLHGLTWAIGVGTTVLVALILWPDIGGPYVRVVALLNIAIALAIGLVSLTQEGQRAK